MWGNQQGAPQQAPQATANPNDDKVFSWDDSFMCEEGGAYILLPEGEYDFTVTSFDRSYFNGSEKSKACPMAKITLTVDTPEGKATIKDSLFLKMSAKWRMDAFFRSIGFAKANENYTPNWNNVIGAKGRARIKPHKYNDKDYNNVDRYIDKA